jgi:CDP-glucose 4,6-dehydratase
LNNFWNGKKVLVTGHTGFKGAWLCVALNHLGARVSGISSDENDTRILWNLVKEEIEVDSILFDISETTLINSEIQRIQPEIIFHLAAQPLVYDAFLDPVNTVKTNVIGTMNILAALSSVESVRAALIVTSDKVYDDTDPGPYSESSKLGGSEIYSASKACAEILVAAFRNTYSANLSFNRCSLATARAGNVFGGGDGANNRLIPDIFRALATKTSIKLRNPMSLRPWQHVFDLTYGYLLLAEKMHQHYGQYSSSWNFSNSQLEFTVEKFLEELSPTIQEVFGVELGVVKNESSLDDFYETDLLAISSDKSRIELGWSPKMSNVECFRETVRWYYLHQTVPNSDRLREFSLKSMQDYLEKIK